MGTRTARRPSVDARRAAALVALGLAPMGAATVRLAQVGAGSTAVDAARFVADPAATVVHLVGVPVFVVGGALQLHHGLRRAAPRVHRLVGRAVAVAGIGIALSGVWMTLTWELPAHDRTAGLTAARLSASSLMAGAFVTATLAARAGRWDAHRAWALRGWAIGMGTGTQALTHVPLLLRGQDVAALDPRDRLLAMLAGWLLTAAAGEWVVRRGRVGPPLAATRPPGQHADPDHARPTARSTR